MILASICAVLLCIGVIDAFLFKYIQQWEAGKLDAIRDGYQQLQIDYKRKISTLQKLRIREQQLRSERAAMAQASSQNTKPIDVVDRLLQQAVISPDQLKKAQQYQRRSGSGKSIEEILILLGITDEECIHEALRS